MSNNDTQNVIDIYKTLLEQEVSNHNIFITILLGITVIFLGVTWWWNKTGAIREIKLEVEKKIEEEQKILTETLEKKIRTLIDNEIKEYDKKILLIECEVMRSMANFATEKKLFNISLYWWVKNLEIQIKLNDTSYIRKVIDWIIEDIESLEVKEEDDNKGKAEFTKEKIHELKYILKVIKTVPDILDKEKDIIRKKLKGREEDNDD